ncbi:ketopantoate reductase panE/ApbA domain-containing protein [Trichoderma breve]|uniref:Ketopantoate reductase panE/ApbA domain-containing protein n=1 Tax=Trichoderma breve TaxID=2034170 RepID=A0A9W9EE56_9HYPO|nr:ketopantoate reductase panE/ApbA domain-containing protein [Trichoderma breve]KAJ4865045.1 ketopantoate reductase panE/ApbA domain-containing protein [Trichoderma breve]
MAPKTPRLKILSVGGNPVSAFLSWRLQATNACDVTLVWKSGFEHVAQYGISFKSSTFGNERFKPRHVVRNPEDAAGNRDGPFDYVILCVKALPDVYDLAAVIESVVTPQHTCILVNTTHTLGIEAAIEERFPTNVVLSLVSGAELTQLGQSEFEHKGSTDVWVGPASRNANIPQSIQEDMAQAISMTLSSGQVNSQVSNNIRQQQYERVIGPIAFHPISVIFETSNHVALLEKMGVKDMISEVIDELLRLAEANGCKFAPNFKQSIMDDMAKPNQPESIMWQDFIARRPMEVETYLGSPIRLARDAKVSVPRIETLYAILHNLNIVNRNRPKQDAAGFRPMMPNGNGMPPRQPRPRTSSNFSNAGGMRRPPPNANGGPNGYGRPPQMNGGGSRAASRRGSMEGNDLEEFSHLVLYDDIPEGQEQSFGTDNSDLALRERELQLRQRELALREQEMRMRRGPPPPQASAPPSRRGPPPSRGGFDDDDEDDDYFDPSMAAPVPMIDPDNFDMMSVTSRKNRKVPGPSQTQMRRNPEGDAPPSKSSRFRPFGRNRSSQMSQISQMPTVNDNILDDPLLSFTSNRYGAVDRGAMSAGSRANSLTASRGYPRRTSHSPGNQYSPSMRGGNGRPSPPNGFGPTNGQPSPPNGMRQPVPRYPPGQGTVVAPQQVEQQVGVSSLNPPKSRNGRSLTGSASASADSGEFGSERSAYSSQGSLQQQQYQGQ